MSLKIRRILYLLFFLAFFILTPLIIFYALGYSWQSGLSLQKTGIIVIDSDPPGAQIYFDDKPRQTFFSKLFDPQTSIITTPAKIKNIKPGEYKIKLNKTGYFSWEKKLSVFPGQTTFAKDIYLFKDNLPFLLYKISPTKVLYAPNGEKTLLLSDKKFTIFNIVDDIPEFSTSTAKLFRSSSSNTISWNNNNELLINTQIFSQYNWAKPINLNLPLSYKPTFLKWDNTRSNRLYYLASSTLYYFDTIANKHIEIMRNINIKDYIVKNSQLYYLNQNTDYSSLAMWDINNKKQNWKINLPLSEYTFINQEQEILNIYDKKYNILYLIDPNSVYKPIKDTINNINKSYWTKNGDLLYANDFEIWLYSSAKRQKTLLTRVSDKIEDIIWHPSNNYIVFSTNKDINILELDNRQKRNITKLLELDNIENLYLDSSGKNLFFTASIGEQHGLYKLIIQ